MIAHVQLSDFFMAVERAARPDLDGRPLVVGALAPTGSVAVASSEARSRGVHAGMRMADARALAPDAVCLSGSIERYLEVSAQIDERFRTLTNTVEWMAVDEAWLHLESRVPVRVPGSRSASSLASLDDVRALILRDFGIAMAIGAGTTKAVAQVASRLVSPAGTLIVLRGYEARLLAPVDIARMPGLPDETVASLRTRGVNTLGHLAALDEPLLFELLGRSGSVVARHALGRDDRPVVSGAAPKGIVRSAFFGSCGPTQARGAIAKLSDAAARALRHSGHAARQVRLRVRDLAGERIRALASDPLTDADDIRERVDHLARRLLHPGRELIEAAVSLTALSPVAPQLELFAGAGAIG